MKPCRMYEALTLPSAFPPCGHDVNKAYRTHSEDLSAQKVGPFVPAEKKLGWSTRSVNHDLRNGTASMDLGIVAAIAMLVVWAVGTFMFEAPGYIHLLLTAGVFLLIWRIVVRGSPKKV